MGKQRVSWEYMKHTVYIMTPLGPIKITATDNAITSVAFSNNKPSIPAPPETPLLKETERQLSEYFSGGRKTFDLPFAAEGTEFQKNVWKAVQSIPYGETRSYGQIAEKIGRPSAFRAVGTANSKNPILILIPCHRIVGFDGSPVGYAGGLDRKEKLLGLERKYANG